MVSGLAFGLVFRGGLSEIGRLAQREHRAQAMSAFFVAAYVGLALPVVLIGIISQLVSTVDASAYVSGLLVVTIAATTVVLGRAFGRMTPSVNPAADGHPMIVPPVRATKAAA